MIISAVTQHVPIDKLITRSDTGIAQLRIDKIQVPDSVL